MSDSTADRHDSGTRRLSPREVAQAGLRGWGHLSDRLRTRLATGDFATGLRLVERIGAAAEAANHHPDITLTYPEVIVTLWSHDVHGVTRRDLDLARTISDLAAELGVDADARGVVEVELGLDTSATRENAAIYAALLGLEQPDDDDALTDPSGQAPELWWQTPQGDDDHALPEQSFEQRWHLDIWVAPDEAERRVQAAIDAGARLVSDRAAPSFWVLEDADGNRSCICCTRGRR